MIRGLNKIVEPQGLGYLASPYTSHPGGPEVAEMQATEIAADLLMAGLVVFAPISYGPGIERVMLDNQPQKEALLTDDGYIKSHEFWMPIDERFFQRCDYAIIAMLPGWVQSHGIAIEFHSFLRLQMPIYFYDPDVRHIMSIGEMNEIAGEEFAALQKRAAQIGTPFYLQMSQEVQTQAAQLSLGGLILSKHMEGLDRG